MKFLAVLKRFAPFFFICVAIAGAGACAEGDDRAPTNTIAARDEELTVLPLQTMTVVVPMEASQILTGYITIDGGNDDIKVYVKDDFGEEIADFGIVSGTQQITYKVTKSGFYTIYFDNSFSVAVNKEIKLHYSVR